MLWNRLGLLAFTVAVFTVVAPVNAQICLNTTLSARSEEATSIAITTRAYADWAAQGAWERRCVQAHDDRYCVWDSAASTDTLLPKTKWSWWLQLHLYGIGAPVPPGAVNAAKRARYRAELKTGQAPL